VGDGEFGEEAGGVVDEEAFARTAPDGNHA
jgi:hypothetical protein